MSETTLTRLDKLIDQHGRWGKLTFADLYDMLDALTTRIAELEQENAKLLDEVTARRFTDERTDKLLDELERKNKRLEEALNTIHMRIIAYEPDNRIEARFFGELKIVARNALDNKAE